jgi:hypothetical protein
MSFQGVSVGSTGKGNGKDTAVDSGSFLVAAALTCAQSTQASSRLVVTDTGRVWLDTALTLVAGDAPPHRVCGFNLAASPLAHEYLVANTTVLEATSTPSDGSAAEAGSALSALSDRSEQAIAAACLASTEFSGPVAITDLSTAASHATETLSDGNGSRVCDLSWTSSSYTAHISMS